MLASAEHNEFHRILKATVGITFLGTPFRGSEAATAAEIRIAIARWAGYAATDRLVKDLDLRNGILEDLIVTFTDLLHDPPTRIPIRCFYETKPSNIARAILPKGLANGLGNVFNKTVSYVVRLPSTKAPKTKLNLSSASGKRIGCPPWLETISTRSNSRYAEQI